MNDEAEVNEAEVKEAAEAYALEPTQDNWDALERSLTLVTRKARKARKALEA